jgi:hypothetical protein
LAYLVDNQIVLSTFSSISFDELEQNINNIPPSMCEYYLNELIINLNSNNSFNKTNIQDSIYFNEYSIYLDYDSNIFIDINKEVDTYETSSLW